MALFLLYIDPGTGSMLFSIFIALAATLAFGVRAGWMKLRFFITRGRRAKADARNRGIVIFTDDKRYWNVFGPVCREAERRCVPLVYMTQSADDPAFKEKFEHVKCEFIGERNRGIAHMNFLVADVVLSTTPNLDVFQWKRSREVKYYVHVPHCITDLIGYRMFGIDSYDAVLMNGDYSATWIRKLEKMRGAKEKELISVGYPPLDEMSERLSNLPHHAWQENKTVLLAPSWGHTAILAKYGSQFLKTLRDTGYHVIVRPHPQSRTSEGEMLDSLMKEFPNGDNFEWNYDNDNFDCLNKADVLISDFSGTIFDFALVFDKPVLYAAATFSTDIYDSAWFEGNTRWYFKTVKQFATKLDERDFGRMKEVLDEVVSSDALKQCRSVVRKEAWTHRGESAKCIVDYLADKQKELSIPDDELQKETV